MLVCIHCSKECKSKNSLTNHIRLCASNTEKQEHPRGNLGKQGWSKGLSSKTDDRVRKVTEKLKIHKEKFGSNWTGRTHSEETKQLQSKRACERFQKNSKYSLNTEYSPGIILESSYEVMTAIILDKLNIKWIKVRKGYTWDDNGKIRRYVPDFYLPEYNVFLDPKNDYLIKKDKHKINSAMELNNIKVIILSKLEINESFIKNLFPPVAQGEQVVL